MPRAGLRINGVKLAQARAAIPWTQRMLAGAMGMTEKGVQRIEKSASVGILAESYLKLFANWPKESPMTAEQLKEAIQAAKSHDDGDQELLTRIRRHAKATNRTVPDLMEALGLVAPHRTKVLHRTHRRSPQSAAKSEDGTK